MIPTPTAVFKTLLSTLLVCFGLTPAAWADEYADVGQLVRTNKLSDAMTLADKHLAVKPADPQMRFLKGVIQRQLGKPTEAIAIFTKLTEDYPELPEPYNNLAVLYAAQGQYDKARAALEMAIRTNPSYSTAHENLGDVYARLASQAYNKALQLDSSNAAVPPKLDMIREVFKPNLSNPRPTAATATTTVIPPAAVIAPVVSSAVPPPAVKPAPPVIAVSNAKPVEAAASASAGSSPSTPLVTQTDAMRAVETDVLAWANAWSNKDVAAYLKAYGPQFTPPGGLSRSAWEKDRRNKIMGKANISVKLSNIKVTVNGDKAVVNFHQAYKANKLAVSSRKVLDLQKSNARWLITRESTGN